MIFVNPYTWSSNEAITAAKLNFLGNYLATYLNGANIAPSQLAAPYSNQMVQYTITRYPPVGGTFLTATEIVSYSFTLPVANWNFVVEKVAITATQIGAAPGQVAKVKFDIFDAITGLSVLVGAAPEATIPLVEVSNVNAVTLSSAKQYYPVLTFYGTAAGSQYYAGVCAVIYGKMLLRS